SGHRATAAMSENDDELEAAAQVLGGILQTPEHVTTEAIAGDPDDEQIVRSLVEDQLQRDPRIRAAENGSKRTLQRCPRGALRQPQLAGVALDDPAHPPAVVPGALEELGEGAVALGQPPQGRIRIRRARTN